MLKRLLKLRAFCEQMEGTFKELKLSAAQWASIEKLVTLLEPAAIATKTLQGEQLTPGDFYATWLRCVIEVKELNETLSTKFVQILEKREKLFMNNDLFLAGLYLDPRYKYEVINDATKKLAAETVLHHIWINLQKLFSGLKFILNPYRLRLKNDMVSDILLLRNNRKLW